MAAMQAIVVGVAFSSVTDLTLSSACWSTRAVAGPYFTKPQAAELVRSYLDRHDASDPLASPLRAGSACLPPTLVQVGDDEILLDDSVRFVERAPPLRTIRRFLLHPFPAYPG